MLTAPFFIIFIAVYSLYASAQNRRLTRIAQQLDILLQMKDYELNQGNDQEFPPEM